MIKRRKKPKKLQQKILLTNLHFFVLPCLIVCLCIFSFIRIEEQKRLDQTRIMVLDQIDLSMNQYLNSIALCVQKLWEDYGINRLISKEDFKSEQEVLSAKSAVASFLQQNNELGIDRICDMQIWGENGYNYSVMEKENTSTAKNLNLNILKKEEWFSQLLERVRIVHIPTYKSEGFSSADKESALHAVCQIRNFNGGEFAGIIDVNISHEDIQAVFSESTISDHQKIILVDLDGYVVTPTDMYNEKIFVDELHEEIFESDQGCLRAKINGIISRIYFVTNKNTGWKIVMYEEQKNSAWVYGKGYLWISVGIIFCIFLAFVMSVYDARYISKPVQKLKEDMRTVYKGNLSVRTEIDNLDEFGALSLQFNMMIEQIEQLIEQLKEKDEEKRVLELRALQAQINPHFLYNTLASIRFLLGIDMQDKADESLMALVKLLRRTFSDYRKLIPFKEELQTLESYLILMNNRYQNTFEWLIEVEDEVLECLVPRISIQPLVENAISHGFNGKESMGHIWIGGRKDGNNIIISVKDDGQGADFEKMESILSVDSRELKEQVSSIGLKNVQERIRLYFGEQYGMIISKTSQGGVCVELVLPAEYEMQEEEKGLLKD